jgi:hypothetical protein
MARASKELPGFSEPGISRMLCGAERPVGCHSSGLLAQKSFMLRLANKGLPAGVAWDADEDIPGALTRSVEADPLRGERCPLCGRAYQGEEEEAGPDQWPCVSAQAVLQLLVAAAREQKTGRDLQVGRWIHLLAFYLGLLPECGSDAELAEYLRVHPTALSESKRRLPLELQALCKLRHKPRKPHSPKLANRGQTPDSIGDSERQPSPALNCSS